jgi:hypothetical protein
VFGLEIIATYPMAQFGDGGDFNQFGRTSNSTKQGNVWLWGLGLHFKHHASDHK